MTSQEGRGAAQFMPPSNSELDCLLALWDSGADANSLNALRVSDVHRRVCERRRVLGETEPTVVTISSQMRSLLQKNLVKSVVADASAGDAAKEIPQRTRGMLSPASRSPHTAYQYLFQPGEVLQSTFLAMIDSYPQSQRKEALVDFARALRISGFADSLTLSDKRDLVAKVAEILGLPLTA